MRTQSVCGVLWFLFLLLNVALELAPDLILAIPVKLFFAAGYILLWTLTCFSGGKRPLGTYIFGLFGYYIWVLLNVLFFDAAFGRTSGAIGLNLQPFFTIRNYLTAYRHGYPASIVAVNLLGNAVAFAPFGFFLPTLWERQRRFFRFVPTIALMVAGVEVCQVLTRTGSGDIDDFILNVAGAFLVWLVLQPLTRYLHRKIKEGQQ